MLAASFLLSPVAMAHPGNTDSSGCHTCRTNCANWGLATGQYHCHGGSGSNDSYCGDGFCNKGETCSTCSSDCGKCRYCGDGKCNNQETCSTCAKDCGICIYCGDGTCNNGETKATCPSDCKSENKENDSCNSQLAQLKSEKEEITTIEKENQELKSKNRALENSEGTLFWSGFLGGVGSLGLLLLIIDHYRRKEDA